MLENIINGFKGQLTGELQNKFGLQPDQADKSVDLAQQNLSGGMKQQATNGDFGGILNVLKGNQNATQSPAMNGMIGSYVNDLVTKIGLPPQVASQIGPFVINFIMNKLSSKANSEGMGNSDIMGMLGGGLADKLPGGLGSKLGGLFK